MEVDSEMALKKKVSATKRTEIWLGLFLVERDHKPAVLLIISLKYYF